jgi:uroporphyrinogen decarboxylase
LKNKGINHERLTKEEVFKAIERRNPERIPLVWTKWISAESSRKFPARIRKIDNFMDDVIDPVKFQLVDYSQMNLSWKIPVTGALDARPILDDWSKLDEFIEKLPDPEKDQRFDNLIPVALESQEQNCYVMHSLWMLFYERSWQIRGMQNLLTDYYLNPDKVHTLNRALCDLYKKYICLVKKKLNPDGFWTSDDLGTQSQMMISPAMFREFLKPYYIEIGKEMKKQNMHWWFHSCGNITDVIEDLIEIGIDMLHPIQKWAMDEEKISERFGSRLGFCKGIDVQHILQEKSEEDVRKEVRFLIDTFDRPEGGMCISAGNSITMEDTPIENILAFLDEALHYGTQHRKMMNDLCHKI